VAGAFVGRALLRLKPSRICANRGDRVRYGRPHCLVNALAGAFIGRPFHPRNLRFPWQLFFLTTENAETARKGLPFHLNRLLKRVRGVQQGR
jgi:hypothetical protein